MSGALCSPFLVGAGPAHEQDAAQSPDPTAPLDALRTTGAWHVLLTGNKTRAASFQPSRTNLQPRSASAASIAAIRSGLGGPAGEG